MQWLSVSPGWLIFSLILITEGQGRHLEAEIESQTKGIG